MKRQNRQFLQRPPEDVLQLYSLVKKKHATSINIFPFNNSFAENYVLQWFMFTSGSKSEQDGNV